MFRSRCSAWAAQFERGHRTSALISRQRRTPTKIWRNFTAIAMSIQNRLVRVKRENSLDRSTLRSARLSSAPEITILAVTAGFGASRSRRSGFAKIDVTGREAPNSAALAWFWP